jgi:FixJ family two-component response regulator
MTAATGMVFVIDDDESVRKGLKRLPGSAGHTSEVFKSANDFSGATTASRISVRDCRRKNAEVEQNRITPPGPSHRGTAGRA